MQLCKDLGQQPSMGQQIKLQHASKLRPVVTQEPFLVKIATVRPTGDANALHMHSSFVGASRVPTGDAERKLRGDFAQFYDT